MTMQKVLQIVGFLLLSPIDVWASSCTSPNGVCAGAHDDEVSMLQVQISSHQRLKAEPACVPYGEEVCKRVAQELGLTLGGNGYAFEGDYGTKGCYSYKSGSYAGIAFFGTGGSESDRKAAVTEPKYRPPGYGACPDVWKLVGKGQCTDADGKFGHIGWASCVSDSGRCQSLDQCEKECSALTACAAIGYYHDETGGYCWMYEKMDTEYTTHNSEFAWYDCYLKQKPVIKEYVTCACKTPNGGTSGKNGFKCSDGTDTWCRSTQQCVATSPVPKDDMATTGCKVTCRCKSPDQGGNGKNGYECGDDAEGYCQSWERCFATRPFPKGDWSKGCRR